MRRTFPHAALAAIALVSLALVGCGGDSSSTQGTSTSTSTASQSAASPSTSTTTSSDESRPAAGQGSKGSPKPAPKQSAAELDEPAPTDPDPLPNQGGKDAAPGVPTTKGGDNSIQRYGLEAESEERVQAAATLQAYLNALAQRHWDEACDYLDARIRGNVEELAEKVKGAPKKLVGCAGMMEALAVKVSRATLQSAAQIEVLSLRVAGNAAFLLYTDGDGTPTNIPMSREGGAWKVGGIAGTPLRL